MSEQFQLPQGAIAGQVAENQKPKPKTLVQKLCEVMAAVTYVQKTGYNRAQEYKYATEADVADLIRGELSKRNVFIFPNMVKNERVKIERNYFDKYEKCMKVRESYATDLEMEWTFSDGDTGEERTCRIPGCSESPGDKGVYVAMTGSEKYLLMKAFLIPTGDDPESDANEPTTGSKAAAQDVANQKLTEASKSPDPKIRKMAEEGLAKLAKASEIPANSVLSLFYVWNDQTQNAEIIGSESLKKLNKDLLRNHWSPTAKAIIVNADELEFLKLRFEERKVPFSPLKTAEV